MLMAANLMAQAKREFGEIFPCSGKTWDECFTVEDGVGTLFWFNDATGSTHMLIG
jgi:hypothetical protein